VSTSTEPTSLNTAPPACPAGNRLGSVATGGSQAIGPAPDTRRPGRAPQGPLKRAAHGARRKAFTVRPLACRATAAGAIPAEALLLCWVLFVVFVGCVVGQP